MKPKERAAFEQTGGRCWYCGTMLVLGHRMDRDGYCPDAFVLDHVTPRSKGGAGEASNLVASCWHCNSRKGSKSVDEYRIAYTKEQAGAIWFSPEQVKWLEAHGFVFPTYEPAVFWAEDQGEAVMT